MDSLQVNGQKYDLEPVKLEDQSRLYQLMELAYLSGYRDYWQESGHWFLDYSFSMPTLERELTEENCEYVFVKKEDKDLGILKFDFPSSSEKYPLKSAVKIHRIYLLPETHGTGLARELLHHVFRRATNLNAQYIWLEAMEKSAQAKRFYEKMGFEQVLSYTLPFEQLKPSHRQIEIWLREMPVDEF
ncbi:GNAT family N-acetyltransferase [Algoriphagus namhaensis]